MAKENEDILLDAWRVDEEETARKQKEVCTKRIQAALINDQYNCDCASVLKKYKAEIKNSAKLFDKNIYRQCYVTIVTLIVT